MKKILAALALTIALLPLGASAQLVLGQTYNTGYVGNTPLAPGAADNLFILLSGVPAVTSTPVVAFPVPAVWAVVPGAQFISPTEDQTYPAPPVEGDAPGTYDYHTTLATNFSVPTQVTLSGAYAADNAAVLYVDGFNISSAGAPAYASLTPFTDTFTIFAGARSTTLDFVVNNQDDTGGTINPTGLLVSNLKIVTTATPEPGTWALMLGGLGVLGFALRRRTLATI
jgi:PEP-CTERM motif